MYYFKRILSSLIIFYAVINVLNINVSLLDTQFNNEVQVASYINFDNKNGNVDQIEDSLYKNLQLISKNEKICYFINDFSTTKNVYKFMDKQACAKEYELINNISKYNFVNSNNFYIDNSEFTKEDLNNDLLYIKTDRNLNEIYAEYNIDEYIQEFTIGNISEINYVEVYQELLINSVIILVISISTYCFILVNDAHKHKKKLLIYNINGFSYLKSIFDVIFKKELIFQIFTLLIFSIVFRVLINDNIVTLYFILLYLLFILFITIISIISLRFTFNSLGYIKNKKNKYFKKYLLGILFIVITSTLIYKYSYLQKSYKEIGINEQKINENENEYQIIMHSLINFELELKVVEELSKIEESVYVNFADSIYIGTEFHTDTMEVNIKYLKDNKIITDENEYQKILDQNGCLILSVDEINLDNLVPEFKTCKMLRYEPKNQYQFVSKVPIEDKYKSKLVFLVQSNLGTSLNTYSFITDDVSSLKNKVQKVYDKYNIDKPVIIVKANMYNKDMLIEINILTQKKQIIAFLFLVTYLYITSFVVAELFIQNSKKIIIKNLFGNSLLNKYMYIFIYFIGLLTITNLITLVYFKNLNILINVITTLLTLLLVLINIYLIEKQETTKFIKNGGE